LDEDFIHVAGLIQYNSFPWINVTPNTILVGIANTDRKRDLAFPSSLESERKKYPTAGQSENFMVYLNEEVIPYVEKHYNINKNRTLVGQSLAGLFAAEVLIKHPEMFNNYILISPSVWWSDGSLLKVENAPFPKESAQPLNVYIAVGDEGLAPSENPHIVKDEAKMLFDKIEKIKPATMNMMFDYMPAEDHATIGHLALYNALKFLAPK
jgi:predicted alpha/beta superfamily hydrolase